MTDQEPTITDADMILPDMLPGESCKAYWRRVALALCGENDRSKADLREWTGSPPFHLAPEKNSE